MKVSLATAINSTGYGQAGTNLALNLDDLGHEVALFPIYWVDHQGREDVRHRLDAMKRSAWHYDPSAPSVRIWFPDSLAEHVGKGPRVGFPFFEVDPLPHAAVHHANLLDRYVVASSWGERVARASGVTVPISVVPLGVDRTIFREGAAPDAPATDATVFFACGKFEVRKGHDLLCRAFSRAFTPQDDVVLRLMCHNPHNEEYLRRWQGMFLSSPMARRIELRPPTRGQGGVAAFMAGGDVGVFPARAEGWNLELLEAMSMGKHVIATRATAHAEFVTDANAMVLPCDGTEPAEDGTYFFGEGEWPVPDEDALVDLLREAHRAKQEGRLGRNGAGVETAEAFSWRHSAECLARAIEASL